jgi:hypothetical protein
VWKQKDGTFKLRLTVPPNTLAEVVSPFEDSSLSCEPGIHELDFQAR